MDDIVKKKLLGQYMTTPDVAIDMAKFLMDGNAAPIILDPACGEGELLIQTIRQYRQNGLEVDVHQILGVDIDPDMVEKAKIRIAKELECNVDEINIIEGDFLDFTSESKIFDIPLSSVNQVIANPPYGKQREILFFDKLNQELQIGTELVLLVPLSFNDRITLNSVKHLSGRPLGVTTGHSIVQHEVGTDYEKKKIKSNQSNQTDFTVHNGLKIYEKGAGNPVQTKQIMARKPYSSDSPVEGWMPCARTGDIQPFHITLDRLWIDYGEKLARPKDIRLFKGPRIFLRRMPIWKGKKLACCYIENTAACAGDVLVIKHKNDNVELLKGLAVFLNSEKILDFLFEYRPSLTSRDSYPKIAAKDINALLDEFMISDDDLLDLSNSYPIVMGQPEKKHDGHTEETQDGVNNFSSYSRYIEFEFPANSVSRASSKEKSVRHGHPSTLQQWWARRPLSVCRSTILASLIPHPSMASEEQLDIFRRFFPSGDLNHEVENLISEISRWENRHNVQLIETARGLIGEFSGQNNPTLIDSFAGGGSIPIEGLRLGLNTISNDLNSIACMNLSLVCNLLPNITDETIGLFDTISDNIFRKLETDLRNYYPHHDSNSSTALWCWSFQCVKCRTRIPLLNNLWLARGKYPLAIYIQVVEGELQFSLKAIITEEEKTLINAGTVDRNGCRCLDCGQKYSTEELASSAKSGQFEEIQYATCVVDKSGKKNYHLADIKDAAAYANVTLDMIDDVPELQLDINGVRHLWCIQYGRTTTSDLFNNRQLLSLKWLSYRISEAIDEMSKQGVDDKTKKTVSALLCCLLNRLIVYNSRHSWWQSNGQFIANMFVRQGISMVWNYCEVYPMSSGAGSLISARKWIKLVVSDMQKIDYTGRVICGDAGNLIGVKSDSVDLGIIDPPYYDMIVYSYLSDIFYTWNKPILDDIFPEFFKFTRPERDDEAIVDRTHSLAINSKDGDHFGGKMRQSFDELYRVLKDSAPLVVMFAHKKIEAWRIFLGSLTGAGFRISSVWPVHMERKNKFKGGKIDALSVACLITCKKNGNIPSDSHEIAGEGEIILNQLNQMISNRIIGPDLSASFIPILLSEGYEGETNELMGSGEFLSTLHHKISSAILDSETATVQSSLSNKIRKLITDPKKETKDIDVMKLCELMNNRCLNLVKEAINDKDSFNAWLQNSNEIEVKEFLMTIQLIDSFRHSMDIKSQEFDEVIAVIVTSLIRN
jgi:adenine-specific DNA methylase/predicted RNA methylase